MVLVDPHRRPDCLIERQRCVRAPHAVECRGIGLVVGWWREELPDELNVHLNDLVVSGRRGNLQLININKADLRWDVILECNERAASLPADPMVVREVHRLRTFRRHVPSLYLKKILVDELDLLRQDLLIDSRLERVTIVVILAEVEAVDLDSDVVVVGVDGQVIWSKVVYDHVFVVEPGAARVNLPCSIP